MQRFLDWLGTRLFSKPPAADLYESSARIRVVQMAATTQRAKKLQPTAKPERAQQTPSLVEFDADLGGRIEDAGPGKNVLVRNKYLREDTGTHETLKIVDDSLIETGEQTGFDPYNTGQFDRSRNWSRTRK